MSTGINFPLPKITKADLPKYKGKEVTTHQLEDILDTYMVLTNSQVVTDFIHNSYIKGILDDYSKEPIKLSKYKSTLVYHPSYEREEFVDFEY